MMKVCYTAMAKKYVSYLRCVQRNDIKYVVRLPIQIKLLNFFESEVGVTIGAEKGKNV
jgi:hypothetical protein